MKTLKDKYDVVVVGGGMSGICAALASARQGAKTVLLHNRTVLGGNASSEVRMHIGGADFHSTRTNARETGLIEEILLDNKKVNPQKSYSEFDRVLWEKVTFQENLTVYLNTHVHEVMIEGKFLTGVKGYQNTTEREIECHASIFIDTTGDAMISDMAGAEIMYGRDAKTSFDEIHAPDYADDATMGLTLLFTTKDMGRPMPFEKPFWAYDFSEDDLINREHSPHGENYWWIELGGDKLHTIYDGENIRDELLKSVYGVWDHIKNKGDHNADNYVLDWVGFLPGKRESRRVVGDYILTERDVVNATQFEDVVAYGGWPMDMHAIGGLKNKQAPTEFIDVPEVYGIPYRALVSKEHENLLIGGRAISVSRMAFGSTRLMATCSVVGQAIGTAAGMAINNDLKVRDINIKALQRQLSLDDAYLPKHIIDDPYNKIANARLTASKMEHLECLRDGVLRDAYDINHGWSDKLNQAFVEVAWPEAVSINEIRLYLDSNLSRQIMLSHFDNGNMDQIEGMPVELIKDYSLVFYNKGEVVYSLDIENNHYRMNIHRMTIIADKIILNPKTTYGADIAKIFEIKVY